MSVCVCVCVCFGCAIFVLLRESGGHGVGHHGLGWLLGGRLGVKRRERRVAHAVLAASLVPAEGRRRWRLGLEVLVLKGGHRVAGAAATTTVAVALSVVVAVTEVTAAAVAVVTLVVAMAAPAIATAAVLALWSATVAPIAIPIPVVPKIPPPPGIPIATVVLVAAAASSGTTSSVLSHLQQLGVDGLVGLTEDRDEVAGLPHVAGREEGVGRARLLAAGRAADAVDVVL